MKLNGYLQILAICFLWTTVDGGGHRWSSRDIELFDLVERVNQNFYTMLDVKEVIRNTIILKFTL